MFAKNTQQLAENKLLLLYILEQFSIPLTNTQITEFVLQNDYLNYFSLQQYLIELVSSQLLEYKKNNKNNYYILTEKGKATLKYFKNRIPDALIDEIHQSVSEKKQSLLKKMNITADFSRKKENEYIINLKAMKNNIVLFQLKLSAYSNEQAKKICEKWKNEAPYLYENIIQLLSKPN